MKIRIAYERAERAAATKLFAQLLKNYPNAKVHIDEPPDGYSHIYLALAKPK